MQGAHGYGGYGYGRYGYDSGAYGSAGGGYGYNAGAYGSAGAGYYSNGYELPAPAYEDPLAGERRAHDFPVPLNGLELQPLEACPKNYVIFDQTSTKSRVMFHPSLAHKLGGSSGHDGTYRHGAVGTQGVGRCPVRQEEDEEEIDALLSSDDSGDEDDVVSTDRTPGGYRDDDGSSPDTACSYSRGGGGKPRKKERVIKMMRTLRGIVPGGKQMDTPAVLDGAVRYLKSLKVEAKKLGVRGGSDS